MTEYDIAAARALLRERGMTAAQIEEFLAKKQLTTSEVAQIRWSDARTARYVVQQLWGVRAVGRQPGRGENLFDAAQVWKAVQDHPGKGWRKGRTGPWSTVSGPRKVTEDVQAAIVRAYQTSPAEVSPSLTQVGMEPIDHWTIKKLAEYLQRAEIATVSWEAVRRVLAERIPADERQARAHTARVQSHTKKKSSAGPPRRRSASASSDQQAELLAFLAAGREAIGAVLERASQDPVAGKVPVSRLVQALPGYGPVKTAAALTSAGVAGDRPAGRLTPQQRKRLLEQLKR